jgi:hypothetical protein
MAAAGMGNVLVSRFTCAMIRIRLSDTVEARQWLAKHATGNPQLEMRLPNYQSL